MKYTIESKKAYHETMVSVYELMNKGEANLSEIELNKLALMTQAAEEYEDKVLGLIPNKKPHSIAELLHQKMYENKMNQAALAAMLGLGASKLSDILNGKRKPDTTFLKALYQKLNIDPAFLLDHV